MLQNNHMLSVENVNPKCLSWEALEAIQKIILDWVGNLKYSHVQYRPLC